jgi:hypothetical protein
MKVFILGSAVSVITFSIPEGEIRVRVSPIRDSRRSASLNPIRTLGYPPESAKLYLPKRIFFLIS